MMMEGEFAALSDIILNCQNKFQFAKTYKTLRSDVPRCASEAASVNQPENVRSVIHAMANNVLRQKLSAMAHWFAIQFADERDSEQVFAGGGARIENAIEVYAGKPGAKTGCLTMLMIVASTAATIGVVVCVVTT